MQYRHTDVAATPPHLGGPSAWSERLALLPHSNLICNHRKLHPRLRSLRAVRPNPSFSGKVAYAYFSQLYKVDPLVWGVWSNALRRTPPYAVLWFMRWPEAAVPNILRQARSTTFKSSLPWLPS